MAIPPSTSSSSGSLPSPMSDVINARFLGIKNLINELGESKAELDASGESKVLKEIDQNIKDLLADPNFSPIHTRLEKLDKEILGKGIKITPEEKSALIKKLTNIFNVIKPTFQKLPGPAQAAIHGFLGPGRSRGDFVATEPKLAVTEKIPTEIIRHQEEKEKLDKLGITKEDIEKFGSVEEAAKAIFEKILLISDKPKPKSIMDFLLNRSPPPSNIRLLVGQAINLSRTSTVTNLPTYVDKLKAICAFYTSPELKELFDEIGRKAPELHKLTPEEELVTLGVTTELINKFGGVENAAKEIVEDTMVMISTMLNMSTVVSMRARLKVLPNNVARLAMLDNMVKSLFSNQKTVKKLDMISIPFDFLDGEKPIDRPLHLLRSLIPNIQNVNLQRDVLSRQTVPVRELPAWIFDLRTLMTFDISGNAIRSLPETFSNLTELRTVNLSNNSIERIPPISRLTKLEELHCSALRLADFPVVPPSVKSLSLRYTYIDDISAEALTALTNVERLDVTGLTFGPAALKTIRAMSLKQVREKLPGVILD